MISDESGAMTTMAPRAAFLPCGAWTGIGSLPHMDARAAVRFVAEQAPEVPFWPQLPNRAAREGAILQSLGGLADLVEPRPYGFGYQARRGELDVLLWHLEHGPAEPDPLFAAGLFEFLRALGAGEFPVARAVKGQMEGPITLASYLFEGDRPFAGHPERTRAVGAYVARSAQAQIRLLAAVGLPVLFFLDEPALCLARNPDGDAARAAALQDCLDTVRAGGALAGLHCCAALPLGAMLRAAPDILSFDSCQGLERLFGAPVGQAFLRNGGLAAYGLIPTCRHLRELKAEALLSHWLHAAVFGGDIVGLCQQAMVTATCGLGLVSEEAARASFALARAVGGLFAQLSAG